MGISSSTLFASSGAKSDGSGVGAGATGGGGGGGANCAGVAFLLFAGAAAAPPTFFIFLAAAAVVAATIGRLGRTFRRCATGACATAPTEFGRGAVKKAAREPHAGIWCGAGGGVGHAQARVCGGADGRGVAHVGRGRRNARVAFHRRNSAGGTAR